MATASSAPEPEDLSSNFGKVRLVVYDFDQTITQEHLYHTLSGGGVDELDKLSDERLIEVFGGTERIERLLTHFTRVRSKSDLAIISYGYVPVILKALQRTGLDALWTESMVIGSDSSELKQVSGNKYELVQQWRKDKSLEREEVCFVDDDPFNIRQAKSAQACLTVEITPRSGMNEDQMTTIEMLSGGHPSQKPKKRASITITTPKGTSSLADRYTVTIPDKFKKVFDPESEDEGTPVIDIENASPSGSRDDFEIAMPPLPGSGDAAAATAGTAAAAISPAPDSSTAAVDSTRLSLS